jgi:hypothetical protein
MAMADIGAAADNKNGEEAYKLESRQTTQYSSRHGQQFYRFRPSKYPHVRMNDGKRILKKPPEIGMQAQLPF